MLHASNFRAPAIVGRSQFASPPTPKRTGFALVCLGVLLLSGTAFGENEEIKSLQDCVEIAVAQHPTLRSADAVVGAANQRVWQAGSAYLPQIAASYDADRRHSSAGSRTGLNVSTPPQTYWFYNGGVVLSQVLFDFGQNLNAIRAAQANERASRADAATQQSLVVFNVKQAYYQLLAGKHLLTVANDTVEQNREHLRLAEGRLRVGLAPKLDVTQAEVQLATADLNQLSADNNVALAREVLGNAMGYSSPISFELADDLETHTLTIDDSAILQTAYTNRPELQGFFEREKATNEQISGLQKNYLPNLKGSGSYQWSGSDYPLQSTWDVGAAVSLSIFNGGLTRAQVGEAEANLARLRFDEEEQRHQIALEVRQATLELRHAERAIAVAERGLRQARENLDLAQGRYRTGVGPFLEVTDAQTSRSSAEASFVQALYAYKIALATLEKATGKALATP